jgi:hypothetical protein
MPPPGNLSGALLLEPGQVGRQRIEIGVRDLVLAVNGHGRLALGLGLGRSSPWACGSGLDVGGGQPADVVEAALGVALAAMSGHLALRRGFA